MEKGGVSIEKYSSVYIDKSEMGARRGRSTETAAASLLARVRAAWDSVGAVASVLALDVSRAFDRVLKEQLIWALRQRGLPQAVYNWVFSFMSDQQTTLAFDGQKSPAFSFMTGIPQGSPLSPILFLFYNAELFEWCANSCGGAASPNHVQRLSSARAKLSALEKAKSFDAACWLLFRAS